MKSCREETSVCYDEAYNNKAVSPVWEALSYLDSQIASVDDITRELETLLQGVLLPEGSVPCCKDPVPDPISAPLVQDLRARAAVVDRILGRLHDIRLRLAL